MSALFEAGIVDLVASGLGLGLVLGAFLALGKERAALPLEERCWRWGWPESPGACSVTRAVPY